MRLAMPLTSDLARLTSRRLPVPVFDLDDVGPHRAANALDYVHTPTNRVVELGTQVKT